MLDQVVRRQDLAPLLSTLLQLLTAQKGRVKKPKGKERRVRGKMGAWASVELARHQDRPHARDLVQRLFTPFFELHGDRAGADDPGVICGLGSLNGSTVGVVAQQRSLPGADGAQRNTGGSAPAGFRKAQRLMELAANYRIPLVTLIDTSGPQVSQAAEEMGIGYVLAKTTCVMAALPVPSVAAVVGEGGSEAALALSVADRILMMEHAIYTPTSPEVAATLMYRDAARVQDAAESLQLTAADCLGRGLIDAVVPEPPGGAHMNPDEAARLLGRALARALAQVAVRSPGKRSKARYKRFRNMGEYTPYFRVALAREIARLGGAVKARARRKKERAKETAS
jgi:acetyl-CoA carboxylase carboxyl transferase alpha subunit